MFKRKHTIKKGETLWGIAKRYYGNPGMWTRVYQYNARTIGDDANRIEVGTVIEVPFFLSDYKALKRYVGTLEKWYDTGFMEVGKLFTYQDEFMCHQAVRWGTIGVIIGLSIIMYKLSGG